MQDAITVQAATRRFGDLIAVNDLSFSVQRGEIFGLVGPNGAGKTTTINLLTGLLRRNGGQIAVLGFDPESEPRQVRRRIGLVPDLPEAVYTQSGNAAGKGLQKIMFSREQRQRAEAVPHLCRYVELTRESMFKTLFARSLAFSDG